MVMPVRRQCGRGAALMAAAAHTLDPPLSFGCLALASPLAVLAPSGPRRWEWRDWLNPTIPVSCFCSVGVDRRTPSLPCPRCDPLTRTEVPCPSVFNGIWDMASPERRPARPIGSEPPKEETGITAGLNRLGPSCGRARFLTACGVLHTVSDPGPVNHHPPAPGRPSDAGAIRRNSCQWQA